MKKTKIKKDLFNRIKEIGSENKVRGITLISLIITIIILLILVGIAIAQLSNSGLFYKAQESKESWDNAQEREESEIAKYTNGIEQYTVESSTRDVTYCTTPATTTSSASVTNPCVVVENYRNGDSWYRVWSDGWIEQGGKATASGCNSSNKNEITFLKEFGDTNYSLNLTSINSNKDLFVYAVKIFSRTKSSFIPASTKVRK